jgi:hypothetical protein
MSPLERLQNDVYARLSAHAYFVDVGVYLLRPRANLGFTQIQTEVDQLISSLVRKAGKGGAAIMVLMPTADSPDANVPGPRLTYTISIRVQELVVVNMGPNGTGKSAEDIALEVAQVLHHFNAGNGSVLVAAPDALTPSAEADPKVTIDVKFSQLSGLTKPAKVASPTIAPSSGAAPQTVTLTCATAGATIRYSIDDSYPTLLYTAPLSIASACTLRVAAEKSGLQQSDVARAVFS